MSYFKLNHEGHQVKVQEPTPRPEDQRTETVVETPIIEDTFDESVEEPPLEESLPERVVPAMSSDYIRLTNLVVDSVDENKRRAVKVYGIAGGMEKFSKTFEVTQLGQLNDFLESGTTMEGAERIRYTWAPESVDISPEVAKLIDEGPSAEDLAPRQEEVQTPPEPIEVPEVIQTLELEVPSHKAEEKFPEPAPSNQSQAESVLLGKLSFVQPGEEYRMESIRISKVLRGFRWNIEPPYVIGAMFDNLMSVQSQTGMMKQSLIDAVVKLGYDFVAVEAPNGVVTAWFRKKGDGQEIHKDEILEFDLPGQSGGQPVHESSSN